MNTKNLFCREVVLDSRELVISRTTYQRTLNEDRVRRIAAEFDERIANEPKVSSRGGRYYVFDGQHTIAARKFLNGGKEGLPMQYKYVIGYLRLSDDDEDRTDESNSIKNQRMLIEYFVNKNEEFNGAEMIFFADDGFTGTSYNRPDFKRMMELVKKEHPCCIIVKDLSRFGRDTITTQDYIEKVLPFLQVRFIAVNDYYDSNSAYSDRKDTEVKFKNLINGIYPEICSKNIKQVLRKSAEAGKYKGPIPPYGYQFMGDCKTSLILDPEAAKVVRLIFDRRLADYGYSDIAGELQEKNVITPAAYLNGKGFKCSNTDVLAQWTGRIVKKILMNPVYAGIMAGHKTEITVVLFLCSDLNGGMKLVKERVLAVPYTTVFIAQLPGATKNIIREDLMQHAKENGYHLDWDPEAGDYVGMTRRFCDIDGIYNDIVLKFCGPGEDIEAYEKSIQRNIVLKLSNEDVESLCAKAARADLTVSQLLENFVYDLVHSDRSNGSDERMYANQWFDRCGFSFGLSQTFLLYLVEWGEVDTAIEMWEELEDYKDQGELDEYEKQDAAILTEALEKMFWDYQEDNKEPADSTLESGMEKVLKWDKERKELLRGNVIEKIMER